MTTETIERAATIERTTEAWAEEPEHAKGQPVVHARQDGDRVLLESGSFTWKADLPRALGGSNEAPSPTAYLLGALAGCAVAFIRDTLAPQLRIEVWDVRATARCEADARGLLGVEGASPALQHVALEVDVLSPYNEGVVQRLFEAWQERCPVYLAFIEPTAVELRCRVAPR